MLSSLLSLATPVVIAHRGGSRLRPENTMLAFERAVALGVDAIECDVHLSKDGQFVVIHDATVDRTTNATGPVAGFTAEALAGLDAAWGFTDLDGRHRHGEGLHGLDGGARKDPALDIPGRCVDGTLGIADDKRAARAVLDMAATRLLDKNGVRISHREFP